MCKFNGTKLNLAFVESSEASKFTGKISIVRVSLFSQSVQKRKCDRARELIWVWKNCVNILWEIGDDLIISIFCRLFASTNRLIANPIAQCSCVNQWFVPCIVFGRRRRRRWRLLLIPATEKYDIRRKSLVVVVITRSMEFYADVFFLLIPLKVILADFVLCSFCYCSALRYARVWVR